MSYSSGGSGGGALSSLSDAAMSNPVNAQVLTYDSTVQKWRNASAPTATPATSTAAGVVQLTGDLGGSSTAPTVPGLALKAPLASPTFTGTVTLPSAAPTALTQAVNKNYVDTAIAAAPGAADATTTATGLVQLAGDLAGTSTSASSPKLAATTNVNSIISNNATVTGNTTAIAAKAAKGANSDITSLTGLTTALSVAQGGTGATSASAALTSLGALAASQKAAASGVASLDANTRVPSAQLGSGTASSSTVLYGDGVWRAAAAVTSNYTWTATKTAAYTASAGDAVIANAGSNGFTVTLPASPAANSAVRVKKIDSTSNAVLVASSANIEGSPSFSLNSAGQSQDFSFTGTTWYAV